MKLSDQLNMLGVQLVLTSEEASIVGYLPSNVTLPNSTGDAVDHSGDRAFFDTSDGKWYPVGKSGS